MTYRSNSGVWLRPTTDDFFSGGRGFQLLFGRVRLDVRARESGRTPWRLLPTCSHPPPPAVVWRLLLDANASNCNTTTTTILIIAIVIILSSLFIIVAVSVLADEWRRPVLRVGPRG